MEERGIMLKEGIISSSDMEIIDKQVMAESFPWYYCEESTVVPGCGCEDFPFLKHCLMIRWEEPDEPLVDGMLYPSSSIDSKMYPFFEKIFLKFCKENEIKINVILRACLNLTYNTSMYKHGDPHVDYPYDIWQVIMYLNEFDNGETLIFEEEYGKNGFNDGVYHAQRNLFNVKEVITPQKGKIVAFYGKNFHSLNWCSPGQRRIACVFVFK